MFESKYSIPKYKALSLKSMSTIVDIFLSEKLLDLLYQKNSIAIMCKLWNIKTIC